MFKKLTKLREKAGPLSLAVLCCTQILDFIGLSGVNVAAPKMQGDLNIPINLLVWIISAYALTYGGLMLLTGRLGDVYGHRYMFLFGLSFMMVWSLVCACVDDYRVFIFARAMQGIGAAATVPSGLALITQAYEGKEREKAIALFSTTAGVGFSVGLVLGGALLVGGGFFLMAIVAGTLAVLAFLFVPQPPIESKNKGSDVLGTLVVTAGLVLIVYSLVDGQNQGWGSALIVSLLVIGVFLLVLFVLNEKYTKYPAMPISVWTSPNFTPAFLIAFFDGGSTTALLFQFTQMWQFVRQQSALSTSLQLMTISVAAVISTPIVTRIGIRFGVRLVLLIGAVLIFALPLGFCFTDATVSFWTLPFLTWIIGSVGFAFTFFGRMVAAVNSAPKEIQGVIGGLINTAVQVGAGLTLSISTAVATSTSNIDPATATQDQLLTGYHNASWTVVGLYGIGLVMAVFFIKDVPVLISTNVENTDLVMLQLATSDKLVEGDKSIPSADNFPPDAQAVSIPQ